MIILTSRTRNKTNIWIGLSKKKTLIFGSNIHKLYLHIYLQVEKENLLLHR